MSSSEQDRPNQLDKSKKSDPRNQKPLKVIRIGAIAASVWRRQTSTGFEYLDFSLSRSWKLKSGEKEGYSQNFFENNEEALLEVIHQTCRYLRSQQEPEGQAFPGHGNVVVGDPMDEPADDAVDNSLGQAA